MSRSLPCPDGLLPLALCLVMLSAGLSPSVAALRVCIPATVQVAPTPADLDGPAPGALLTPFVNGSSGAEAEVQTLAAAFRDGRRLYLVVRCLEPEMAGLVARCVETDSSGVFADDCVEVFISPEGRADHYYHLAANSLGTRYDEIGHDKSWNGDWEVAAEREDGAWSLVFSIPFSAVGGLPEEGAIWWLNVDRQRQVGGELALSSWSPTGRDFHNISNCGRLVLCDDYAACLRRGILAPWQERSGLLAQRAAVDGELARRAEGLVADLGAELAPVVQAAQGTPGAAELSALLDRGYGVLASLERESGLLSEAIARVENRRAMRDLAGPGRRALLWAMQAITDEQVLPTPRPPEAVSDEMTIQACRGEYEPASFVVYALEEALDLECTVGDLTGEAGTIPAAAVDLRSVKCWYQSGPPGRFPLNKGMHLLTPELLLKDDTLVGVDEEARGNYVRLSFPNGSRRWLWISSPEPLPEERDTSVEAMPIRDAETLQPIPIAAETAKRVWVTVHVPAEAASGEYVGEILLSSAGRELGRMRLRLTVLPFDLEPNCLESSIYFHWGIDLDLEGQGTVAHSRRSLAQYKAELRNLLQHGVDNPTVGVRYDTGLLRTVLEARREVGMRNDHLYYLVAGTGTPSAKIREIIEIGKEFGFEDVYFYGRDEAQEDALTAQREEWQRVHQAGGRVFVAGSQGQNFPLVGDLQDLLVCYGDPSKEEAARWHGNGHKIFSYANPQSGSEVPETYRRNFGLLLAANDYDGSMTYIYYHGWNDFSGKTYRQHNFIYPTADGCIDTIQWEGYREGQDDLRYLATLRKAISQAAERGGRAAETAAEAQAFVDGMDVSGDLDALRREMVDWTLRLMAK